MFDLHTTRNDWRWNYYPIAPGHEIVVLVSGLSASITVLNCYNSKEADALQLDADRLLVSSDAEAMSRAGGGFDLIIDTVPIQELRQQPSALPKEGLTNILPC